MNKELEHNIYQYKTRSRGTSIQKFAWQHIIIAHFVAILFYICTLSLAKKWPKSSQNGQKTIKFPDFVKNCGRNYPLCF